MPLSPSDSTDESQSFLATIWCLRVVVFLQCVGVGGRYFFSSNEVESDVYGWLFFDHSWPEVTAQRIDDFGALGCLAAGCVVLTTGVCHASGMPGDPSLYLTGACICKPV